jgi:hypothetical protein
MTDKCKIELIINIIEDYMSMCEIKEASKDYIKAIINNIYTIATFSEKTNCNKILNE